ncbi:hypothetical protein [Nocardioides sp.]|jgi:hypothetical protein|uniref:hypothetical protein n=1 Tax=Nocardioides sp. TaxID=35761 RepID=UPI002F3F5D78
MAERIITTWKLAVLRAWLDYTQRAPFVGTRLDGYVEGTDTTYWNRQVSLEEFGLSSSSAVPEMVRLPPDLIEAVQSTVSQRMERETVLWLRLKPPYGYLGAAPWEDLAADIGIPVLRVPDRLPAAAPLGLTWRVALAVNAPSRASWGARHAQGFISALRATFKYGVEVDVFADAHTRDLLLRTANALDASVRVHDPDDARAAHERRTARSDSPSAPRRGSGLRAFDPNTDPRLLWSDWIAEGLGGTAVRALHFASEGVVTPDQAGLAITPDPAKAATVRNSAFVETADLRTLADRLGASLVSIAAPEVRGPDIGARMVADSLGQLRSGPTIFSSIDRDPGGQALADVHLFLARPGERQLPAHRSWFGYVQPDSLQRVLDEPLQRWHTDQDVNLTQAAVDRGASEQPQELDPALTSAYQYVDNVPVWVASSSRFLEAKQGELNSLISLPGQGKASKLAYDQGASEALNDIQNLLSRHVRGT